MSDDYLTFCHGCGKPVASHVAKWSDDGDPFHGACFPIDCPPPPTEDRIAALEARAEAAETALVEARAAALEEAAKVAESPKTELFLDEWTAGQCSAAIHTMISMAAAIRALAAKG